MRCSVKLVSTLIAAVTVVAAPRPCAALGTVYCANCSTEFSQVASLAKQAQQLMTQLQSYQTQLMQYANMVQNTVALPTQVWGTVQGDIMQVRNLSNAASLLSGNAGSMISRLQSATGYVGEVDSLSSIAGQFTMWQQTIGNNLNTMGRVLGLQQSQTGSDAALLTKLQTAAASATGQMQAIEAGNQLAGANAAQLYQINQTLMATAQMEANQVAVDADRNASEDHAVQQFVSGPLPSVTGYQSW